MTEVQIMNKINIAMYYTGTEMHGQGVGAATIEQINLIEGLCSEHFTVSRNKGKKDIVHVHTIDPKSRRRAFRSKVPVVMHVHFLPETLEGSIKLPKFAAKIFQRYFLKLYRRANHVVVVNPIFIEPLTTYGIGKERITYIPNFVSEKTFFKQSEQEKNKTKEKLGIPKDKFVVLGVGQVQTRKGVLDFVEVANALPDVEFVWAGGFSFGAITDGYKDLKKVVENPPKNVRFTGIMPRSEMNNVYNAADLLFMPSYNELFPMAILEACSSETPMLLRDLELYEDILFKKYNQGHTNKEFIAEIKKLKDDPKYYKAAVASSLHIKNYYSRTNVAKIWTKFYLDVHQKQIVGKRHLPKTE